MENGSESSEKQLNRREKQLNRIEFIVILVALSLPVYAEVSGLSDIIRGLQPMHGPAEAASWAGVFELAAAETGLDPLLLVAISFRESSIRMDVIGDRGEIGALQLHGASLRHLPRGCDVRDMTCNIRGGAAYLQWVRAKCGGSWSRWVGAYGMRRCPSEAEAASMPSVRRAREIYESIGGEGWR